MTYTVSTVTHYNPENRDILWVVDMRRELSMWLEKQSDTFITDTLGPSNDDPANGTITRYWANRTEAELFKQYTTNLMIKYGLNPENYQMDIIDL